MTSATDWVTGRLPIRLLDEPGPLPLELPHLVGLALRRNPRRAHLLVSTVLGKHVPTPPDLVHAAGLLLGAAVAARLLDRPAPVEQAAELAALLERAEVFRRGPGPGWPAWLARTRALADRLRPSTDPGFGREVLVLGYAETATGLGHAVAEALSARCLHSTRRQEPGPAAGGFAEEHSHATQHLLRPDPPEQLTEGSCLVLVDDELSTGRTALNTIQGLHAVTPRQRYVIACLVDGTSAADRGVIAEHAAAWNTSIEVVCLARGHVELGPGLLSQGRELAEQRCASCPAGGSPLASGVRGRISELPLRWPSGLAETGRHGVDGEHTRRLQPPVDAAAKQLAAALEQTTLPAPSRLLVLNQALQPFQLTRPEQAAFQSLEFLEVTKSFPISKLYS